MSLVSRAAGWGTSAIVTAVTLAALAVGGALGLGLAWVSYRFDAASTVHTLLLFAVLAAIGVDLAYMARTVIRLARAYGRTS